MCGIAGIVGADREYGHEQVMRAVRRMIASIQHRGPDGVGFYDDNDAHLAHARLSIIDLKTGNQPLYNETRDIVLVCNGEIYGYRELRTKLKSHHRFVTRSDCEVIVHLFEEKGTEFVDELNGMFAVALFEKQSHKLTLCIDERGIKPLYCAVRDETLIFASELRSVITGMGHLGWNIRLDEDAIRAYLQLGWVPAPKAGIETVRKFRPGEIIQWQAGRLWNVRTESQLPARLSPENSPAPKLETLKATLSGAIDRQLIADVPVGFFLSGGIDSSLLVALAAKRHSDLRTFTVRFCGGDEAESVNESDIAKEVASFLGTRHQEFPLDVDTLRESLDEVLSALDEPLADPACLPLFLISRLARSEVKVCLSGDGGDELFGGYPRHYLWPYKRFVQRSYFVRKALVSGMRLLPKKPRPGKLDILRKLSTGLDLLVDPNFVKGPFGGDYGRWLAQAECTNTYAVELVDQEKRQLEVELNGPLAGQLLAKTDRMSMQSGLEVRVPYLDREVVRIAQLFTQSEKIRYTTTKIPLRRLLSESLPPHIVNRPKRGFRVPISSWFRGPLRDQLRENLVDDHDIPETLISRPSLARLVDLHIQGRQEHSIRLWALLVLNRWIKSVRVWESATRQRRSHRSSITR